MNTLAVCIRTGFLMDLLISTATARSGFLPVKLEWSDRQEEDSPLLLPLSRNRGRKEGKRGNSSWTGLLGSVHDCVAPIQSASFFLPRVCRSTSEERA